MCKENINQKMCAILFVITLSTPGIAFIIWVTSANGVDFIINILIAVVFGITLLFISCGICIWRGCKCCIDKPSENAQENDARLPPTEHYYTDNNRITMNSIHCENEAVIGRSSNGIIHDIHGLTARYNRCNLDIGVQGQGCITEEMAAHPTTHTPSTQHPDMRSNYQMLELPKPPAYDTLFPENDVRLLAYDAPPPTYDAPPPTYDAPPPTYDAPPPTYDAPPLTINAPPQTFDALPPTIIAQPQTSDAPPPTTAAPPPSYDAPPSSYDAPPPSDNAPPPSYDVPPPSYDAPLGPSHL
ncbi:unnamed protein product [Owenia fusiformis]|uniref:Uncharacterized protein n=1 Tax=Owenia fusiformis TaxID=6347 RepID=A0A8J1Y9T0_OWEFU|nr:unnamed protein product [Owenia fusiformis]